MELGKVCIDSIKIFVPSYQIEGGLGVIGGENFIDALVGDVRVSSWKKWVGDDGVEKVMMLGDGVLKKWGRCLEHEADRERCKGMSVEDEMNVGNGVWWKVGSKNLGLNVRRDGGDRSKGRGVRGLYLKVSSKHLESQYFDGISKKNWDVVVERVEKELGCRFLDGLKECVVDRIDIKSDVRLNGDEWEMMKRMIEGSIRGKMKSSGKIRRFGRRDIRGYSGIRFGVDGNEKMNRKFPLFTVYSKERQFLEVERFRCLMEWMGFGKDDLVGIYRFECSVGSAGLVREKLGGGSRKLKDVLFDEDDFRYVKTLRSTMEKWMDVDMDFGLEERSKVKLMGDGEVWKDVNEMRRGMLIWKEMRDDWSELYERGLLEGKSDSLMKRDESRFWSEENVRLYVERVFEEECEFMRLSEGLGKSDARYSNRRKSLMDAWMGSNVAKKVYELGLVGRGVGGRGKRKLGEGDKWGKEIDGLSMRRLMRKVGMDLFDEDKGVMEMKVVDARSGRSRWKEMREKLKGK